jgi:dienelactone hydrolase
VTLDLSPSRCHAPLLDAAPKLAYAGQDVARWQQQLRGDLQQLLGLHRMPKPGALEPSLLWQRELPFGSVSKIAFVAEPGAHALAYVALPYDVKPPYRFVICLQGHSSGMHNSIAVSEDESASIVVEGDRDFALHCLKHGYAALALEQRSLGERRERLQPRKSYHNDCHDAAMRALMLGRTLLGERVYDVDRAIDYLAQRGDADMSCIGVLGNSGGGTVALYSGALLSRVGFVVASCCFGRFRDTLMTIHHCSDNYVPGLYEVADMPDIAGLIAPRPAVIVAARQDAIFPFETAERAFASLSEIYAGAGERVRFVVGDDGHRFYADAAFEALRSVTRAASPSRLRGTAAP